MRDIEDWIYKNLVGEDQLLKVSSFESSLPLYFTPLANNFVSTIINGSGVSANFKINPGEYQYNNIVRKIASISNQEPAVWFYYSVIDNAVGMLNEVWECNYEFSLDYALEKFEREPAAQGGVSFLGLLSRNKSWLLLHTYEPGESLQIDFYGKKTTVGNLENVLTKNN
ncbi:MAG: hypothetical protein V4732_11580 [Pseudomonadota bacterium]